jgi:hypothetical protein
VPKSIVTSLAAALVMLVLAPVDDYAQGGAQEPLISQGVVKMPTPPGPAPKRDLSGTWVGPRAGAPADNAGRPDPIPPMTPAGEAAFKEHRSFGDATRTGPNAPTERVSNDPFQTCDPLGFPRNLLGQSIEARGSLTFGSAPDRLLMLYQQGTVYREIWTDGRALPKAVDVRGAPESRYYGHSIGRWENDYTFVIETTGFDERPWLDEAGHPRSPMAHITERYTRKDQYNIDLTVTMDDPKYYTKSWVFARGHYYWKKDQQSAEWFCIPSEALDYRDRISRPSGIVDVQ